MKNPICLLLSLLLLSGCMPIRQPFTCAEIVNLHTQIGQTFTRESLRSWIHDTYQVPLESIREDAQADSQSASEQWGDPDHMYYSISLNQGSVEDITVGRPQASVGDMNQCLGQPGAYLATYKRSPGGNQLSLNLVYPDDGVLTSGSRIFSPQLKAPPAVTTDFPVSFIRFVRPGTTDQVLSEIYVKGWGHANDGVLQEFRPWVGDWASVVIDVDPAITK